MGCLVSRDLVMNNTLLKITDLNKSFGGVCATDNVNVEVERGEIHALIGPNGAGKTTLISQISGILQSDSGEIQFDGTPISHMKAPARSLMGIARSFQITSILREFTCQENVALAIQAHFGHSYNMWKPVSSEDKIQNRAVEVLESVGMGELRDTTSGDLAHGEQRQLELAIALAMDPKLLILDEPLAGMGRMDSVKIVNFLNGLKRKFTILVIEHDMDAVFTLADRISVMVYGRLIASGTPDEIRADAMVRSAYLGVD